MGKVREEGVLILVYVRLITQEKMYARRGTPPPMRSY